MTRLAIYDLDETITRRPTFARWLMFWAARRAPLRLPLLSVQGAAMFAFAGRLSDRRALKLLGIDLLTGEGVPYAIIRAEADAFVAREIRRNVFQPALDQIANDRGAGCRLLLATASMAFYAEAFARALGFEATIATRAGWRGDATDFGAAGPNCYGDAKLARIEAWMADVGIARAAAHVRFYSDHISDHPTFAWADEPVAINPAPALTRIAHARGWRIERWR
jgi:HAD superfamily hydrolase (TIGR01490 family)